MVARSGCERATSGTASFDVFFPQYSLVGRGRGTVLPRNPVPGTACGRPLESAGMDDCCPRSRAAGERGRFSLRAVDLLSRVCARLLPSLRNSRKREWNVSAKEL